MEQVRVERRLSAGVFERARGRAEIYRVLANPRRLMILEALAERELSVGQIAESIGASLPSTSQHLQLLRHHALVCSRREGHTVYYRAREDQPSPELAESGTRRGPMSLDALDNVTAAKVVDARAMSCPGPLLEAKKGIGSVKMGEVLEIWSADANTKADMPRWCEKVGHEFLGVLPGGGHA